MNDPRFKSPFYVRAARRLGEVLSGAGIALMNWAREASEHHRLRMIQRTFGRLPWVAEPPRAPSSRPWTDPQNWPPMEPSIALQWTAPTPILGGAFFFETPKTEQEPPYRFIEDDDDEQTIVSRRDAL